MLPRLILGSSSLYRQELLRRLRMPFEVMIPAIDELPLEGEQAHMTALRLAREKALAILQRTENAIIIGCDQVATMDGQQIGKPGSHEKAFAQLRQMRGREVVFHTALCVVDSRAKQSEPALQIQNVQTFVQFRNLSDEELNAYLIIEQPYDCAGSAKNEGLGIALLERIESSDPTALTGLPLIALTTMLRKVGMPFFEISAKPLP